MPPVDGGGVKVSENFNESFAKNILNLLTSKSTSELVKTEQSENLFKRILKQPSAWTRLESVHTARSFKYGAAHFGAKFWYRVASNI